MQRDWLKNLLDRPLASRLESQSDDQSADKRTSRPADKSVKRQADMKAGKQARRLTTIQTDYSAATTAYRFGSRLTDMRVCLPITRQTN
ncbi:hypothetical protein [Bacteroides uniformis]|uniref:hypothetical protein n=1 Tax=Bacteroides uniformis TaxID=820 RepID=UPI001D083752|nr:hypothetical protein [Bacteroides uniformis]MCB6981215.1 hypothetical protein [Bacteroides uniformis]MCB7029416.1 hypothetical protein [Bacteroides uniformis]